MRIKSLLRLVGALLLASGALLAVLALAEIGRPTAAKVNQDAGYVDGERGKDIPSCGVGLGTQACKTIQYAIDEPSQYDIIKVAEGVYSGSVRIERDLTLQGGWNYSFTAWSPISYETVISSVVVNGVYAVEVFTATMVVLDGLTVFQGDDGVHLDADAGARLTNLRVHGAGDEGIESNGVWLIVSNTLVFDTGDNGVWVKAGSAEIYSSTIHDTGLVSTFDSRRGIYLRSAGPHTISATVVYNTANDGIYVRDADAGSLIHNRVFSLTGDGIQIRNVGEVLIDGTIVYDVSDEGIQIQSGDVVTVQGNTVYSTGSDGILAENAGGMVLMRGNTIYATESGRDGIHVSPGVVATITGNTVHDVTGDAIDFRGLSGVIEDNRAYNAGDQGINVNAGDTIVMANTVYDTQAEGLRVRGRSTVLVQGNTIYNTLGDKKDGIHVEPNVDAMIKANTVYSAAADGITFNGRVGTISENDVHDNGASGIDVDADKVTISANRVFGNAVVGIELENAASFTVSNNLVGENLAGSVLAMGASTGTLVNNTLVGHPSSPPGVAVAVHVLSSTVTLTSANNIIVSHTVGISVVVGAWVTTTYDNVWHNDVNLRGIVSGRGGIQQDPLLRDVAGRDYHLRFGSLCIDAGWTLLAPPLDFEGDERIGEADIGADELVGLSLVKVAPSYVEPGEYVTYTLTITNHLEISVTNVLITDALPSGANWITAHNGGELDAASGTMVSWTVPTIDSAGGMAQVSFVVTAEQTIINERYQVVSSDQGVSTHSGPPVVTLILKERVFLPLVVKDGG